MSAGRYWPTEVLVAAEAERQYKDAVVDAAIDYVTDAGSYGALEDAVRALRTHWGDLPEEAPDYETGANR